MYSSTPPSTSALDGGGGGGQRHAPAALPPGKNRYPLYRRLGGAPGPVWTGAENLAPHRDSIPGPPSSQQVAIPLELFRPTRRHPASSEIYSAANLRFIRKSTAVWARTSDPVTIIFRVTTKMNFYPSSNYKHISPIATTVAVTSLNYRLLYISPGLTFKSSDWR